MTAKIGQLIELTRALGKNDLPNQSDISRKLAEGAIRADCTDSEDVGSSIVELISSHSIPADIYIIRFENKVAPAVKYPEIVYLLNPQATNSEYIITTISIRTKCRRDEHAILSTTRTHVYIH